MPITTDVVSSNPAQLINYKLGLVWVRFIVLNGTFNNISVISLLSVLLVEETGGYLEKTTDLPQVTDKLCLSPLML
jgi:hypothetical protein